VENKCSIVQQGKAGVSIYLQYYEPKCHHAEEHEKPLNTKAKNSPLISFETLFHLTLAARVEIFTECNKPFSQTSYTLILSACTTFDFAICDHMGRRGTRVPPSYTKFLKLRGTSTCNGV
jgi:hypothetical protein